MTPTPAFSTYSGADNLDAMEQAQRYSAFLKSSALRCLRLQKDSVGVDFGAGSGYMAEMLASHCGEIFCVEPDPNLRLRLSGRGLSTRDSLDAIEPKTLDFCYSFNVLEHIEDDIAAVRLITEKLKGTGRFFFYVPAFQLLYSSMDRHVGHVRRYSKQGLLDLTRNAGLNVEGILYADSLGFFLAWIYKLISPKGGILSTESVKTYDRLIFPISLQLDRFLAGQFGKNLMIWGSR